MKDLHTCQESGGGGNRGAERWREIETIAVNGRYVGVLVRGGNWREVDSYIYIYIKGSEWARVG